MELKQKLAILADAAKFGALCASGSAVKRSSSGGAGTGSTRMIDVDVDDFER